MKRLLIVFAAMVGCSRAPVAAEEVPVVDASRVTRKSGDDWPAFLGATGDSKSRERGILTDWPAAGPKVLWQRELGTGYAMPTISDGRLFQFERIGDDATLTGLESETGRLLWKFTYKSDFEDLYGYDNGPRSSPIVNDGRVYCYGPEGMLHCVSANDGKLIWKVDTKRQFGVIQNFFGVGSTPVVEDDLLIVQVGGSPQEDQKLPPGSLDRVSGKGSGIVAFDKLTGKVRYQNTNELASYASPTLATIDGRRWCFMFARGGLVAFEPATGNVDFEFPWRANMVESVNASNPVVIDNQVFISEGYSVGSALLKVMPGKYEVVWSDAERRRDKAMLLHWNTPIHIDGYLYGSSGRHEGSAELRCIEVATGKVKWSEPDLRRSSLLHVDGHFVCLSEDGVLRLLKVNPEKYEKVAECVLAPAEGLTNRFGLGDNRLLTPPAWAAPILSHGLLYVRGRDRLVCLELIPE
jgi:outer membrane protein assembly factor BamB